MTTIGDLDTARMLFKHFGGDKVFGSDPSDRRAPKGFKRVGQGCYRTVYLDKTSNVVYKIGDWESNMYEAAKARALRRKSSRSLGFDLVVPHTRTYRMPDWVNHRGARYKNAVAAQEYAGKTRYTYCQSQDTWLADPKCNCKATICFSTVLDRIADWSDLADIHGANVLVDKDERFWLIDLAG